MSELPENGKCPACGNKNLVDGTVGMQQHTFIPTGRTMWVGYTVKAFVCLDCGFLSHYLEPEDLKDIQKKAKS